MRTIDIFVCSPADVKKESAVAEQLIRSAATEFCLPIEASYCNPWRGRKENVSVACDESAPVLRLFFWEYPELEEEGCPKPDLAKYSLVIYILWSRLESGLVRKCVMPDGTRLNSAAPCDLAWILDQSKETQGFPELRIYRNRAAPNAKIEPKEERENLCRQWDALQNFFAEWKANDATRLRECCNDYHDLAEFAKVFRGHFRNFLAHQLAQMGDTKRTPRQRGLLNTNPFRGLNFFDLEHATFYCGRTGAIGEVLDALEKQARAKKPLVLVWGPSGSGKSSLVRAGVLPLLIQGRTPLGSGPWRRAVTRPGVGDPIDSLAEALIAKFALPELQDADHPQGSLSLASQLRKDPESVAARIVQLLDQLNQREFSQLETERLSPSNVVEKARAKSLEKRTPKLVLVVDPLEDIFTGAVPVLQRKYIAALCALASCERIFIVATLRSDFYPHYQRFTELVQFTSFGGRCELQLPGADEIEDMVRFPAEAAGLSFERDPETGRNLGEVLVKAAVANQDRLPLLEYILSRLYARQEARKDGLLRWSDYGELDGLENALAHRAEFVFLALSPDERDVLKFVMRHLLVPGSTDETRLSRRPVPYRDLVSSPTLNQRQSRAVEAVIEHLVREGLLCSDTDRKESRLISIPQDVLISKWPRLRQSLSADRRFFGMRDRLDESFRLWLSRGRQNGHLLCDRIALAEAETLLKDFGASLNKSQIQYIEESLASQRRRHHRPLTGVGLAAIIALAVFGLVVGIDRFTAANRQGQKEPETRQPSAAKGLDGGAPNSVEARLKEAEEKLGLAQENADLAARQRTALETQLKEAAEKLKQLQELDANGSERRSLQAQLKEAQAKLDQLQTNASSAAKQLSALQAQLKQEQDKEQKAKASADSLNNERSALQGQLRQAEEKAQLTQQNANVASSEREVLETQLKEAQEKLKQLQANSSDTANQLSSLQEQVKQEQDKEQKVQANADSLITERTTLRSQLKQAEEKAQLAQQNAEVTSSQLSALEAQFKDAQAKFDQLQTNSSGTANQLSALQAQLKEEQDKEQKAQGNVDSLIRERAALQTQLKQAKEETRSAQQNAEVTSSQRIALETQFKDAQEKLDRLQANSSGTANQLSALQAQLKEEQDKEQKVQATTDSLINERTTLQNQLKQAEEKADLAQENADLATRQVSALQAQLRQEQEKSQNTRTTADFAASELKGEHLDDLFPSFQVGVIPQQKKNESESEKYARLNPPEEQSPTPTPSANGSETATPPESQFDRKDAELAKEESLNDFVLGYLRTVASNDTSIQRRYFADRVSFYGRGILDSSKLEASTQEYHREWPVRAWTPTGEAEIRRSRYRNLFVVYQPFQWAVSDGSHRASGKATLYLLIRKNSQGEYRIVNVHQLDR